MNKMRVRFGAIAVLAAAIFGSLGASPATAADQVQKGDMVAVCGDSITEQKEYSGMIETYLAACQQGGPIRAAQFGWSGDSMTLLWTRGGPSPILAVHPTVVTTCYGMNDGGYKPIEEKTITTYRDGMTRLVRELKKGGVRFVVVGSPGVVDSTTFRNDPQKSAMYNPTLAALSDVAKQIAQEQGCGFANVHDVMMDVMTKAKAKYGPKYPVAGGDGIHPGANGHLVMAYAFLKAMGCDGNIGTITMDLAGGKATATDGHRVVSSESGTVEIESTRYPFCFFGKPDDPSATTGIIEFFPFNDDLNRFKLVVSGLPEQADAPVRVTWGNTSKEFKAGQLAKGINLAAEFLDNPFSEPFQKVRATVRDKQLWETKFYKSYLSNLDGLEKDVQEADPDAAQTLIPALQRATPALVRKDTMLANSVAAAVEPVKHTIKVEVVK